MTERCRIAALILLLFFLTLTVSCGGGEGPEGLFRFIDMLEEDNIIQSPFRDLVEAPDSFKEEHEDLHSLFEQEILQDAGIGDNPLFLKKKMKIGPVEINAILAPPATRLKFSLTLPENPVFEVTYGIRRDDGLAGGNAAERRVRFSAVLTAGEEREILLDRILILTPEKTLEFNYKKTEGLERFEGREVDITLITKGDEDALACWFNPVVYRSRESTRNVVLISLDTLRADHLGCYGYGRDTSPNIDRLAGDSALFLNTYASSPWTLPSHVSLMTSLNCINHRVYREDDKMDPSLITLADLIRSKDYFLSAVTGGGFVSGLYGFSKGFDSYHVRGEITAPDSAAAAAADVLDYIERHADRNFFLFVHTYQIHNPYLSPPGYAEYYLGEDAAVKQVDLNEMRLYQENRYKPLSEEVRRNLIDLYDAEIRYTDEALIKPVVEKLKSLGLYDNTMILLLSDHGEEFYEHGSWVHTHSVYDETIKVPLLIKHFGSRFAGSRISTIVRLVDAMPTILDALDIDTAGMYMDGSSLGGLLDEESDAAEDRTFLSEMSGGVMHGHIPKKLAVNSGRNKLILNDPFTAEDLAFFRYPPPVPDRIEIFDILKDPGELKNLVEKNPRLARRLMEYFQAQYVQNKEVRGVKARVSEEIREQLRALGYIR